MAEEKAVRIRIAMVQLSGDQWGDLDHHPDEYLSVEHALSISNLTYSEPGSPFPDCRGIQCGTRGLPERQAFS